MLQFAIDWLHSWHLSTHDVADIAAQKHGGSRHTLEGLRDSVADMAAQKHGGSRHTLEGLRDSVADMAHTREPLRANSVVAMWAKGIQGHCM